MRCCMRRSRARCGFEQHVVKACSAVIKVREGYVAGRLRDTPCYFHRLGSAGFVSVSWCLGNLGSGECIYIYEEKPVTCCYVYVCLAAVA